MSHLERQDDILSILSKEKKISVEKLSKLLYVSEATIRRDLAHMDNLGLLRRTYGGAMMAKNTAHESAFAMREAENIGAKKAMCGLAIREVNDHDVIYMDSSSTILSMIPLLQRFKQITVITHGIRTALMLSHLENVEVYISGGKVGNFSNSILGSSAIEFYNHINADVTFLSCSGFNINGDITDNNIDHASLKRKMIENSKRVVLLVDNSKFGKTFMTSSFKLSDVDVLVTDKIPPQEFIDLITSLGCKLLYA
ncbi:DeoR/GlpR family DNA-binding transcription regulator [Peloplasma aerotolerans]|uniref:DeoR/GlpR family DNA-binding transcription regulator n=1 Tax=Peloplasma aerotolerans TaxID=3044389 RepID=A0AAW6U9N7_9MOLU|nr:DeoR/GlpR family DNA-binding transcription regulator [Mariniplasma sp. M4Ah]MDI6452801.1 DeoR/GlpR family DNA-binding transcription regulator [Mariniplasma sp. M4Ah]